MSYIVPRVQIEQEFTQAAVFADAPLAALIIGPHYKLFRYSESSEKALTAVTHPTTPANTNLYDSGNDVDYAYPNKPANSAVDQSYVKVFFEKIEAQYFPLTALGSSTSNDNVSRVAIPNTSPTKYYTNRISSSTVIFKTNDAANRSAFFADRDVQPGDVIELTEGSNNIKAKVAKVLATKEAAVVGTIDADANNADSTFGGEVAGFSTLTRVSSGSTYNGTKDITYILTVVRSGPWYTGSNADTCARLSITSDDVESYPTVNVAEDTNISIGATGIVFKFPNTAVTGLTVGNKWYVSATAEADGDANILEITGDLSAFSTSADAITIKLSVPKESQEIPQVRDSIASTTNWDTDADSITVQDGISIHVTGLVDNTDEFVDIPVKYAKIYVQYRALLQDSAISIGSLESATQVATTLGQIHPDNPLAQGVYNALLNSSGAAVYYVGLSTDDLAGYNAALNLAEQSDKVYGITPLTFDSTIQDAVVAHVEAMSSSAKAKWRVAWLSRPLVSSAIILDKKPDDTNYTCTVADDPLNSGTQYTLVSIADAELITDGIRIGDSLLTNFTTDLNGKVVYDTFTISEVRTETSVVVSSPIGQITQPIKCQIRRNYTKDEQVNTLALVGSEYNNRRVRMVFPDTVKSGSVTQNGYFVAAALAGLRSGVVPHQGLTNIQLLGFDNTSKSVTEFSQTQLNVLAEQGYWIVTQAVVGATVYTRHQLTTDSSGLNFSEDSITTNVDSISYGLQKALSPYIGIYNINPNNLLLIRAAIDAELRFRATSTYTVRAGNQLIGYKIVSITQNETFKDRVDVVIELTVPYPMNVIKITLIV